MTPEALSGVLCIRDIIALGKKKTHTPVGVWVGGGLSSEQGFLVRVQESTGIALAVHALDQVRNERR